MDHFLIFFEHYGYIAVFLGTMMEGEVALLTFAFLAYVGVLNIVWVMVVAFLGAMTGDHLFFGLSKYGGGRIKFLKRHEDDMKQSGLMKGFKKNSNVYIFIMRFLWGTRVICSVVAAQSKIKYSRFAVWNISAILLWVILYGSLGYFLGEHREILTASIWKTSLVATMMLGVFLVGKYVLATMMKNNEMSENKLDVETPLK